MNNIALLGLVIALAFGTQLVADTKAGTRLVKSNAEPLPFGITSFGAVGVDETIYLYGGHTGPAHTYSLDGMSGKLLMLDTRKQDGWKTIGKSTPAQGLALVAHRGKLIRIGGLTIEATKEAAVAEKQSVEELQKQATEDTTAVAGGTRLRSLSSVESFDPRTAQWTQLRSLPEPRSSHDAVIDGDWLYVIGGWTLDGEEGDEEWLQKAYRMNLAARQPVWEEIAAPAEARRAHSLAALNGKLYLIGGMSEGGDVLNDVAVYDIKTNRWSEGPEIPSDARFASFGNSAFTVGESVYCLGIDGVVRKLSNNSSAEKEWSDATQLDERFFHRLVRLGKNRLAIVGGANMETGFNKKTTVLDMSGRSVASLESPTKLHQQLGKLKSATPDEYESLIATMNGDYELVDIVGAIRSGVAPAPNNLRANKLEAGWSAWEATDQNAVIRPYQLYLPPSVAEGRSPSAVVVHIHGAVGKPDFGKGLGNPAAVGYAPFLWPKVADANNLVIVCPVGRGECAWWTDNGVGHIHAVIRDVRRSIDVPDQSIFCAGFSDGGSGCYYQAMAAPGPFAGFLAMNGHPKVANASGRQMYLQNMALRPFIAGMTQEDSLYPSRSVLPHVTQAITHGAPIVVISYPKVNHQPLYFDDQVTTFTNFFKKNPRDDEQNRLRWVTADTKIGKVDWLEIQELGEEDNDSDPLPSANVMSSPGRVTLGVELEKDGNIRRVSAGSAAATAGMKPGDKIIKLNGQEVVDVRGLRAAIRGKSHGDLFTCDVARDGETRELVGSFPEFQSQPTYSREKPTGYVEAELILDDDAATIQLSSRYVRKVRVWLPDSWSDRSQVRLQRGNSSRQINIVWLSSQEFLERYAENPDRSLRRGYVDISL